MASAPSNKIERAHQLYREGRYEDALGLYTEALALAKTNPQKIALHSNRAACFLKLHRFNKAAEECTSVLELDQNHTGALMLRAQTLVTLKEYHSALFDVNRLIELNPSSEVYQNLEARLRTQLSLAPIPESEAELEEEEEEQEQEQENENDEEGAETIIDEVKEEQCEEREIMTIASARTVNSAELNRTIAKTNFTGIKIPIKKALSEQENGQSVNSVKNKPTAEAVAPPQAQHKVNSAEFNRTIAKTNFTGIKIPIKMALSEQENGQSVNSVKNKPTAEAVAPPQAQHKVNSAEFNRTIAKTNFTGIKIPIKMALSEQENGQSVNSVKNKPTAEAVAPPQAQHTKVNSAEFNRTIAETNFTGIKIPIKKALSEQENGQSVNSVKNKPTAEAVAPPQAQRTKGLSEKDPKGWQSIPKPKGHSALDYARWDRVEDDSSEDDDDDDDEEAQPQYRFRLKTVGVRPVK